MRNARLIRNQNLSWQAFFASVADTPWLKVVYEDPLSDQEGQFVTIGRFLDPNLAIAPQVSEKTHKQSGEISKAWAKRFQAEITEEHAWILAPQAF